MNTRSEIQQAFEDFEAGRLGTVPASHPLAESDEVSEQIDSALD
jgi:hypothetical protein